MKSVTSAINTLMGRSNHRSDMIEYESEKLLGRPSTDASMDQVDIEQFSYRPRTKRLSHALNWTWRLVTSGLLVWATIMLSNHSWPFYSLRRHPGASMHPEMHPSFQNHPQMHPISPTNKKVSCSCGNSVAEAKSMGCRYDALASAWLPPACIDTELSAEFDRAGPEPDGSWVYYTDFDKTGTYTLEEVAALADTGAYYYNTLAWHLAHCTFNWRKAVRARYTGVTLEARADTEGHVEHVRIHSLYTSLFVWKKSPYVHQQLVSLYRREWQANDSLNQSVKLYSRIGPRLTLLA
ncbi:MAG: hypothetical protein Q9227_005175 [Pyrenula ochraceoflavens]